MPPTPADFEPGFPPPRSPHTRDRALRRVRRLTRWIAVASVAGAAALGGLYTHLLPGGSAAPAPAGSPVPGHTASSSTATGDDDREHGPGAGAGGQEDDEGEGGGSTPAAPPTPSAPPAPPTATRQLPHATTGAS
ncbi:hypothetical protein [Streptomyces sp. NPDC021608]|uniref:hypothetical protein n=1 Tax=Streptomyces sp. NPDC021608 TaxID=3154903 RepID=UPI0033E5BF99